MLKLIFGTLLAIGQISFGVAAEKKTRLWNSTGETIAKFELAPAGTNNWGQDQCKNDKDGTVEDDERLPITGIESGQFDARITFPSGRVCFVRGLKIITSQVFSVEKTQLEGCNSPE